MIESDFASTICLTCRTFLSSLVSAFDGAVMIEVLNLRATDGKLDLSEMEDDFGLVSMAGKTKLGFMLDVMLFKRWSGND